MLRQSFCILLHIKLNWIMLCSCSSDDRTQSPQFIERSFKKKKHIISFFEFIRFYHRWQRPKTIHRGNYFLNIFIISSNKMQNKIIEIFLPFSFIYCRGYSGASLGIILTVNKQTKWFSCIRNFLCANCDFSFLFAPLNFYFNSDWLPNMKMDIIYKEILSNRQQFA